MQWEPHDVAMPLSRAAALFGLVVGPALSASAGRAAVASGDCEAMLAKF